MQPVFVDTELQVDLKRGNKAKFNYPWIIRFPRTPEEANLTCLEKALV